MKDFLLVNMHNQFTGDRVTEIRNSVPTGVVIRKNDPFKDNSALVAQPLHETEYYAKLTENNPTLLDVIPVAEEAEKALIDTMLDLATRGLKVETTSQDPGLDGDELNTMPPNAQLNRNPRMPMFKTHDGIYFYHLNSDEYTGGVRVARGAGSDKKFTMCLRTPVTMKDLEILSKTLTEFTVGETDVVNFVYKKTEELLILKQLEVIDHFSMSGSGFISSGNAQVLFGMLIKAIANIAFKSVQADDVFQHTTNCIKALNSARSSIHWYTTSCA